MSRFLPFLTLLTSFQLMAGVLTGLEVFNKHYPNHLAGKRVGLITNPTGVDRNMRTTVDLLHANPKVNLVLLLAPEHGIRGDLKAGELVPDMRDTKTGLPVYTLYGGKDHRPPVKALNKIDTIVYDIQDVGSRAYTFIWTLAEAMAAAAEHNKEVVVFDRPSVMPGQMVDGTVTEKKWISFIGLYPVPRVYGMTVGELARYLNKVHKINCKLTVIPMAGYRRGQSWASTNLPWVPTSPNIPTPEAAIAFAATGAIGTMSVVDIGVGTPLPFQIVAAPWINAQHMADYMNGLKLEGVFFRPFHSSTHSGLFRGKSIQGVQLHFTGQRIFPATIETCLMYYLKRAYPQQFIFKSNKINGFDKAVGNAWLRQHIDRGTPLQQILTRMQSESRSFGQQIAPYLIYK